MASATIELAITPACQAFISASDASSTTNNNTTTGPSGQTRIKNERYGGLHGQAYEFEGF